MFLEIYNGTEINQSDFDILSLGTRTGILCDSDSDTGARTGI
jgi:hypothetical protein